eukprot:CAMPEP_0195093138 /NCGR_PEP_ID=MMETSP0448-20130528/40373_1 /TAXON_ID=66468 /ORGANISM="Heterocapsa triquestra, Strain CCMP 448" /LENGTH=73 /DNA_ID=CAMNT_0040127035 /DNA_START=81 /DNA_END=299 /DNA_ORIENTATION=-
MAMSKRVAIALAFVACAVADNVTTTTLDAATTTLDAVGNTTTTAEPATTLATTISGSIAMSTRIAIALALLAC